MKCCFLCCSCAMSFSINRLKAIYVNRTPATTKSIHVYSSALKASITWNNMRILQVSPNFKKEIIFSSSVYILSFSRLTIEIINISGMS